MKRTALKADPEQVREFHQRGRARSVSKPRAVSPASPQQRERVAGRRCVNCGSPGPCALCRTCHRGFDERTGPQARIDLAAVLALPEFAAERAHMSSHLSYPAALHRLTGERWAAV